MSRKTTKSGQSRVRRDATSRRWSHHVTQTSHALELDEGVFTLDDPSAIARSLKRSAEKSRHRKSEPFRSAMSMLTFHINRAGDSLSARRRTKLEQAKDELRELYHRPRKAWFPRVPATSRRLPCPFHRGSRACGRDRCMSGLACPWYFGELPQHHGRASRCCQFKVIRTRRIVVRWHASCFSHFGHFQSISTQTSR